MLKPGPSLAGLADAACRDGGMARLDDDELIGVLRAWRRLESWSVAGALAAMTELARRRPADGPPPAARPGEFPQEPSEFTGDELAAALALTRPAAGTFLDVALDLARLPETARALTEGRIDYVKVRIIAEATRLLSDAGARAVEQQVLARAEERTTGWLRQALARAVLAADPEATARRREEAQKDPRVRRWREEAGTAALSGSGLPPAEVLAADQAITNRALDLRAAGMDGTLDELRARVFLDALLGRDSRPAADPRPAADSRPAADPGCPGFPGPGSDPQPADNSQPAPGGHRAGRSGDARSDGLRSGGSAGSRQGPRGAGVQTAGGCSGNSAGPSGCPANSADADACPDDTSGPDQPATSGSRAGSGDASRPGPAAGTGGRLAAQVILTVPLTTLLGLAREPGAVAGFGPVDPGLARQLARSAAAHPATRWCLTVTAPTGQAIAHGCAPGQSPGRILTQDFRAGRGKRAGPGGPGDRGSPGRLARGFTLTITPLAAGGCDHRHQEPGYQPSRRLRHLVEARNATCTAPGCRRAAAHCDLDHTVPYDQGGRTCECDLAPTSRAYHHTYG